MRTDTTVTRARAAVAALALVAALAVSSVAAHGAEATARIYVEVTSTSDHASFAPSSDTPVVFGTTTVLDEHGSAWVDDRGVHVNQRIDRAESGREVRAEALLEVERPLSGMLVFEVSRGHIGSVSVRVFENVNREAQLLGEVTWDGINESGTNSAEFAVRLVPGEWAPAPLGYDANRIDRVIEEWTAAVVDFDLSAAPLYSTAAKQTFIVPGEVYETTNARQAIRDEEEAGPDPDLEYSQIGFSPPLRFPAIDGSRPKYVCVSSYGGVPSGTDVLWFEERSGEWRIARQVWKIGIDFFR